MGDVPPCGIALTIVRDLYAAAGWQLENDQPSDYLPNILELAARTGGEEYELVEVMLLCTARVLRSFTRHCLAVFALSAWLLLLRMARGG